MLDRYITLNARRGQRNIPDVRTHTGALATYEVISNFQDQNNLVLLPS